MSARCLHAAPPPALRPRPFPVLRAGPRGGAVRARCVGRWREDGGGRAGPSAGADGESGAGGAGGAARGGRERGGAGPSGPEAAGAGGGSGRALGGGAGCGGAAGAERGGAGGGPEGGFSPASGSAPLSSPRRNGADGRERDLHPQVRGGAGRFPPVVGTAAPRVCAAPVPASASPPSSVGSAPSRAVPNPPPPVPHGRGIGVAVTAHGARCRPVPPGATWAGGRSPEPTHTASFGAPGGPRWVPAVPSPQTGPWRSVGVGRVRCRRPHLVAVPVPAVLREPLSPSLTLAPAAAVQRELLSAWYKYSWELPEIHRAR